MRGDLFLVSGGWMGGGNYGKWWFSRDSVHVGAVLGVWWIVVG